MEHFFENIHGWFTFPNLYNQIAHHYPNGSHFVEIGVWKGKSAAFMAVELYNQGKTIKFDCIDTWDFVPSQIEIPKEMCEGLYETFLKNIESVKHQINPIKSLSWDGADYYVDQSLDFIGLI